jgi:hypothetical protein
MFSVLMNSTLLRARIRPRRLALVGATAAVAASLALHAAPASASTKQIAIIQDGANLNGNPQGDIAQFRALGATTLRVMLQWYTVAPSAGSTRAPRFSATNPNAYPAANWAQWDAIIKAATAGGMKVDLDVIGAPPRWAQGSGIPSSYLKGQYAKSHYGWKVNAGDFGQFVQAVGTRYDGKFKPTGSSTKLPKVSIWSLWNEPNMGQQLGPQNIDATAKSNGYDVASGYYRNLLRTGWSALQKTEKGSTMLVGEFAGQGRVHNKSGKYPQGLPGNTAISSPVPYIESLYCLTDKDKPLSGTAAKLADCPTTASARGSFVKDNPALFNASAVAMHPYASTFAPNEPSSKIPSSDIVLPVIGRLTSELTAVTKAWHHTKNYSVWSTEYGFVTSPPQKGGQHYPSPAQAATYLNQAEYLSWRNPRVASYAQYLLTDPPVVKGAGLFSSGLIFADGKDKPAYNAYRLPLWLPSMTVKKGAETQIWGGARPGTFDGKLGSSARRVTIQELTGGSEKTLSTVTGAASNGYFDTHVKLLAGGTVRLAYTYPSSELGLPLGLAGTTVYSRTVKVTVK